VDICTALTYREKLFFILQQNPGNNFLHSLALTVRINSTYQSIISMGQTAKYEEFNKRFLVQLRKQVMLRQPTLQFFAAKPRARQTEWEWLGGLFCYQWFTYGTRQGWCYARLDINSIHHSDTSYSFYSMCQSRDLKPYSYVFK
jgi:hypothetical protein